MHLRAVRKKKWGFYEVCQEDGNSSFLEWLDQLNLKYRGSSKRLLSIIDQAAEAPAGPTIYRGRTEISHEVDKNNSIYEFIAGDLRLLWFYSPCQKKVVICGGHHLKKGKKVNKQEVKRIVRIKKQYEEAYTTGQIIYFDERESRI